MLFPDMPPPMLLRFDRAEWPAEDLQASFMLWRDARKQFADVHGWPGGFVAMFAENWSVRHALPWGAEGSSQGG